MGALEIAIADIQEEYPKTSTMSISIFKEWLTEQRFDELKIPVVVRTIIKNDNRKSNSKLPNHDEYVLFWEDEDKRSNPYNIEKGDCNHSDYCREKYKSWPSENLISMCESINLRIMEGHSCHNWEIDFLSTWEILAVEQYHAERAGLNKYDIGMFLRVVRNSIFTGEKYDRPFDVNMISRDHERSNKTVKYEDVAGRF